MGWKNLGMGEIGSGRNWKCGSMEKPPLGGGLVWFPGVGRCYSVVRHYVTDALKVVVIEGLNKGVCITDD